MPQSFRLRLGDGTILTVDHGGLSTWETDPTAAVGTKHPNKWIPLKEFLVQERAEALRRAREGAPPESPPAATPVSSREDGLPLVPPPPLDLPSPPDEETPVVPPEPDDDVSLELPAPAEEPGLGGEIESGELFVPEEPRPPASPNADAGVSAVILPEPAAAARPAPLAEEIDLEPLAAEAMASSPPEELPVIPLQPLEDETKRPPSAPSRRDPVTTPEVPSARVQPLEDDPASEASTWSRRARACDEDPVSAPDEPARLPVLLAAALQWMALLGVLLSRALIPINRLDQGLPVFGYDDPLAPLEFRSSPGGEISFPTVALDFGAAQSRVSTALRLDALRERTSSALRELPSRSRGWLDGVTSRVAGLSVRSARPQTLAPSEEPAAPPLPAVIPEEPATPLATVPPPPAVLSEEPPPPPVTPRRRARQPPPASAELPALRLAPIREPQRAGDVYAGDEPGDGRPSIRLWTQRLFLTAAVLAGGAFAGSRWDTWSPVAGHMGGTIFSEIDGRVRWWHLARERQAVIDQASEQFPHLARDTVGLILSTNRTHILEPPVVFETAWGAAERGASTLTASEMEELERLSQELFDELPPLDRERLRTFDQAYTRGAVFPFDARRGLLAYARGARALPPERRERLQTLLGKAIAAGLDS